MSTITELAQLANKRNLLSNNTVSDVLSSSIVSPTTNSATTSSSGGINDLYNIGSARLAQFNYNTGINDTNKRAYLKVAGNTSELSKNISDSGVATATQIIEILNQLTSGYKAFILTNIQENLQERQNVMPTVGDTFAATFSGADPQIVSINGMLPFDNRDQGSWFTYFMNSYVGLMRASILAKYKCWLEIVIPDYQTYKCYPVSISCSLDANSDTLVQFGMSAIVMNDWQSKYYGSLKSTTTTKSLDEQAQSGETNSTSKVADDKKDDAIEDATTKVNEAENNSSISISSGTTLNTTPELTTSTLVDTSKVGINIGGSSILTESSLSRSSGISTSILSSAVKGRASTGLSVDASNNTSLSNAQIQNAAASNAAKGYALEVNNTTGKYTILSRSQYDAKYGTGTFASYKESVENGDYSSVFKK